jgi:hypothetical protein
LAWIIYGVEPLRDRIATVFAIAALVALPFNLYDGYSWRRQYVAGMKAFEQDLSAGLSLRVLADKHADFFKFEGYEDYIYERMRMLHDAKIGPIGRAAPR